MNNRLLITGRGSGERVCSQNSGKFIPIKFSILSHLPGAFQCFAREHPVYLLWIMRCPPAACESLQSSPGLQGSLILFLERGECLGVNLLSNIYPPSRGAFNRLTPDEVLKV